jgi:hypothetical protein
MAVVSRVSCPRFEDARVLDTTIAKAFGLDAATRIVGFAA